MKLYMFYQLCTKIRETSNQIVNRYIRPNCTSNRIFYNIIYSKVAFCYRRRKEKYFRFLTPFLFYFIVI